MTLVPVREYSKRHGIPILGSWKKTKRLHKKRLASLDVIRLMFWMSSLLRRPESRPNSVVLILKRSNQRNVRIAGRKLIKLRRNQPGFSAKDVCLLIEESKKAVERKRRERVRSADSQGDASPALTPESHETVGGN